MGKTDYDLSQSIGHLLLCIGIKTKKLFMQKVERYGVTAQQCPPLMVLYRGTCGTPTEMARAIGIDVGAVSRLVDRLEKKGFVTRVPHEQDMRSIRVELTDEGRRIAPLLLEASEAVNEELFGNALGKVGAKHLHKMLRQVATDLSLDAAIHGSAR